MSTATTAWSIPTPIPTPTAMTMTTAPTTIPTPMTTVLTYMLDHNVHHCAELKEMAASLTGEAQHQLLHAVEAFEEANSHLAKAVAELK